MRGYNQPTSENRRRQFGAEFRRRQSGEEDKKSQWRRSCLLPLFTCSHTRVKATSHFIPPRGASRWRATPRWRESLAPANRAGAAPLPNARSRRHSWISVIAPSAVALDGTFGVTPLFAESLHAAKHLVRRMVMRGGWGRPGVCQREGAAAGVWWAHRRIARCSPHGRAAVVAGPRCNHETSV